MGQNRAVFALLQTYAPFRRTMWKTPRDSGSNAFNGLESLELWWACIERLVIASVAVGIAELFRFGPEDEIITSAPDCMGRIERIAFFLIGRAAQQIEAFKAGKLGELGIAVSPNGLEIGFVTDENLEAIHCDEHC